MKIEETSSRRRRRHRSGNCPRTADTSARVARPSRAKKPPSPRATLTRAHSLPVVRLRSRLPAPPRASESTRTMGRKKAFIDKKNAVTYALMARPEGEEDGDDAVDPAARGAQVWMRKDDNHHVRDALAEAAGDDGSVFNDAFETGTMYSGATGMTGYSSMSNVIIMGPTSCPAPSVFPARNAASSASSLRSQRRPRHPATFAASAGRGCSSHPKRPRWASYPPFRGSSGNAAWMKNRCFSARTSSATAPPPSPSGR